MTVHIMVDLETLGTYPDSPIIAIGATIGDINSQIDDFYGKIKLSAAIGAIDLKTIEWWFSQSKEAIEETFFKDNDKYLTLSSLLCDFAIWIKTVAEVYEDDYLIYGNGADFDLVMLKASYKKCMMQQPWNFRKQMCYRTLKNQFPLIVLDEDEVAGVKHCALDDAKIQHKHLMRILNHIDNMESFYSNAPY